MTNDQHRTFTVPKDFLAEENGRYALTELALDDGTIVRLKMDGRMASQLLNHLIGIAANLERSAAQAGHHYAQTMMPVLSARVALKADPAGVGLRLETVNGLPFLFDLGLGLAGPLAKELLQKESEAEALSKQKKN